MAGTYEPTEAEIDAYLMSHRINVLFAPPSTEELLSDNPPAFSPLRRIAREALIERSLARSGHGVEVADGGRLAFLSE